MWPRVKLPTTPKAFTVLVDTVCQRYGFTDKRHAAAVISVAIRHLPNDRATTTHRWLANNVTKALANHVANFSSELIKHEVQVDMLEATLKADPLNAQARDELIKVASDGSEYAAKVVEKLGINEVTLHVVPDEPA